jgi:iron-sulfur cluster assembly protein
VADLAHHWDWLWMSPKDNDKVYDNDTLKFLIEESLLETCGEIKLEYIEAGPRSGFGITSTNPVGGGGGCSSGSCSSGSCG